MEINKVENFIFCIEKLEVNGQTTHERNNILSILQAIKHARTRESREYPDLEKRCIDFIIKQSKKKE